MIFIFCYSFEVDTLLKIMTIIFQDRARSSRASTPMHDAKRTQPQHNEAESRHWSTVQCAVSMLASKEAESGEIREQQPKGSGYWLTGYASRDKNHQPP